MLSISGKHYNIIQETDQLFPGSHYMMCYKCSACSQLLEENKFYPAKHSICKECYNKFRREKYKLSICRYCKTQFHPGKQGHYKFCSAKCRFMEKVVIDDHTGCWIWQGSISLRGYGKIVCGSNRGALAHRFSYELFHGKLENEKVIIHSCDNTKCVNPDHLRLGTRQENTEDARLKGRLKMRGRLTKEHVLNIRKLYYEGTSTEVLASIYKRSQGTIMDIIYRVSWKEI